MRADGGEFERAQELARAFRLGVREELLGDALLDDMPSFEELASELGIDAGLVKFKFKALGYKDYEDFCAQAERLDAKLQKIERRTF